MFRTLFWIWALLSSITGALSLASLIVNWATIDLSSAPQAILDTYRQFLSRLFGLSIELWFDIVLPNSIKDMSALWLLSSGATFRIASQLRFRVSRLDHHFRHEKERVTEINKLQGVTAAVFIILGPIGLIFALLFITWNLFRSAMLLRGSKYYGRKEIITVESEIFDMHAKLLMEAMTITISIPVGAAAFFYWNYLSLQM